MPKKERKIFRVHICLYIILKIAECKDKEKHLIKLERKDIFSMNGNWTGSWYLGSKRGT